MKKRTLALYESSKSIYGESPFISGLMQGGKADYLFGSAFFVCYECYEKVCVWGSRKFVLLDVYVKVTTIIPGQWYIMPAYHGDHMLLQGGLTKRTNVKPFYLELVKLIAQCR